MAGPSLPMPKDWPGSGTRHAARLYLAVLDVNPRGRAFWLREGFTPTGKRGQDKITGHWLERLEKVL